MAGDLRPRVAREAEVLGCRFRFRRRLRVAPLLRLSREWVRRSTLHQLSWGRSVQREELSPQRASAGQELEGAV